MRRLSISMLYNCFMFLTQFIDITFVFLLLCFFCFLFLNGEDKIIGKKSKIRGDGHIHDHQFPFLYFSRQVFLFIYKQTFILYFMSIIIKAVQFNLDEQQNVMLNNNYLYVRSTLSLFFIISAVFFSCSFWWTFFQMFLVFYFLRSVLRNK